MKEIALFSEIVLSKDLPGTSFKKGDVGTVVHIYEAGKGFEIEFFALDGTTLGVETVGAGWVARASGSAVLHVREVA